LDQLVFVRTLILSKKKRDLDAWRQEQMLLAPCILFTSVIELGMAGLKKPQQSVHSKPVDDATANECKHEFTLLMRYSSGPRVMRAGEPVVIHRQLPVPC
jgi:hypothetical protein